MSAVARVLARYGFVPIMLFGFNAAAIAIVMSGQSYLWLGLVLLGAIAFSHAAERIAPAFEEWNDDHEDTGTNIVHAAVYEMSSINGVLLIPLLVWLLPTASLWPTDWPIVAQLLLAIVAADFAFTIIHYLSHRYSWLWRLHAIHHGVTRLYGFNGLVRHPLHQTIDMVIGTLPLVLLGMPVEVAVLLGVAIAIQLMIQHANVDYALGPFRNHLSIGQLHHMHHVNWGTEGDCNFGLFF
ncbi:MAG: sterol desaturase family protein, partial [Pseudomonadota bacterium]